MASRRAYAPVMHAELGLMEFSARRLHSEPRAEAVSHADLYAGMQATVGHSRRARAARPHGRGPAHRRVDGRGDVAGDRVDRGRARRRPRRPVAHLRQLQRAGAPPRRRHGRARTRRSRVELPGVVRGDAAPRPRDRRTLRDREARNANRAAMLALFEEFAATFSGFDDFEAALAKARLAVGEMRPLVDAGEAPWAQERGALVDVGDDRQRAAAAAALAVPVLGGVGRHDGPARVAGRAQPRGAARGARPQRRRDRRVGARRRAHRAPRAIVGETSSRR